MEQNKPKTVEDFKPYQMVKIADGIDRDCAGEIGYVRPEKGYTINDTVFVGFDYHGNHQLHCGVAPEHLEVIGNMEDFVAYSIIERFKRDNDTRSIYGNRLLEIVETIFSPECGIGENEILDHLIAFMSDHYGYNFKLPQSAIERNKRMEQMHSLWNKSKF